MNADECFLEHWEACWKEMWGTLLHEMGVSDFSLGLGRRADRKRVACLFLGLESWLGIGRRARRGVSENYARGREEGCAVDRDRASLGLMLVVFRFYGVCLLADAAFDSKMGASIFFYFDAEVIL